MFIPVPMPGVVQTRTDGAPGRGGQGCRVSVTPGIGLASYGSRFGAAVQQKRPRERGRPTRKIGRPHARLQGRCRCKRGRKKAQEMPWRCPGAAERRLLDARGGGRQWQSDNTKQYIAALISGRQAGVAAQVAAQARASNTQVRPEHAELRRCRSPWPPRQTRSPSRRLCRHPSRRLPRQRQPQPCRRQRQPRQRSCKVILVFAVIVQR